MTLLTAAVLLSGCTTEHPKASDLPVPADVAPTPTQATAAPTATASAPRTPSAAPSARTARPLAPTPEQEREINDVITKWYDVLNSSRTTLDPSAGRALFAADCKSCARALEFFDETKQLGERLEGGGVSIVRRGDIFVQPAGRDASVQVFYEIAPMRGISRDGKVAWENEGVEGSKIYSLRRDDGRWVITFVEEIR